MICNLKLLNSSWDHWGSATEPAIPQQVHTSWPFPGSPFRPFRFGLSAMSYSGEAPGPWYRRPDASHCILTGIISGLKLYSDFIRIRQRTMEIFPDVRCYITSPSPCPATVEHDDLCLGLTQRLETYLHACPSSCRHGTKKVSPRRIKPLRELPMELSTAPGPS